MSEAAAEPLANINLPAPTDPLIVRARHAVSHAQAFKVGDQMSYELAGEELKVVSANIKRVEALHRFYKDPILEAGRRIDALFKPAIEAWQAAQSVLKLNMLEWSNAERKRLEAEQQERLRLAQAERARAETEALERATAAAKTGDAETANRILEDVAHAPPPAVAAPVAAPRMAGVTSRTIWKAKVTDMAALVRAVADGKASPELLEPNLAVIGQRARALKHELKVPGIAVWPDESLAARTDAQS